MFQSNTYIRCIYSYIAFIATYSHSMLFWDYVLRKQRQLSFRSDNTQKSFCCKSDRFVCCDKNGKPGELSSGLPGTRIFIYARSGCPSNRLALEIVQMLFPFAIKTQIIGIELNRKIKSLVCLHSQRLLSSLIISTITLANKPV